jgi:16S rRNA (uracil1498-N3)-methyltransferase
MRTEHKSLKLERMNGILIAAMLQSRQAWLPLLGEPVAFKTLLQQSGYPQKLIAHCQEENKQFIQDLPRDNSTQILIGPEGDFTVEEIKLALQNNYLPVTLGQTRLRTETAGVVAASLLVNR